MGYGEDYWHKWVPWYKALALEERIAYRSRWPENGRWIGFYDFIENGTAPPWIEQDRKMVEAAAIPPREGETRIDDAYRIRWLLARHMKRIGESFATADGVDAMAYKEPNGARWVLIVSGSESHYFERVKA
jgi:hypothetical protein